MISRRTKPTDGVILLKPIDLSDVSQHFDSIMASKKELKPWMSWLHAKYTIKDTRAWAKLQLKNWTRGTEYSFCILDAKTREHLGGCGLNRIDPMFKSANLGYWVRSSCAGRGTATRATRLLARFGLQQLKLRRIEISMAVRNVASRRVAEKAGAVFEGRLRNRMDDHGKVCDAFMFSVIQNDLKKKK